MQDIPRKKSRQVRPQHLIKSTLQKKQTKMRELSLQGPVDGGLPEQLVIQHRSSKKLVADAIPEAAVDLRTTAMGVKDLEHLHLLVPIHVELRHFAIQSH